MKLIIENYDAELAKRLRENYQIEELDIEDVLTSTQLSKLEKHSNYWYVSLQFPEFQSSTRRFKNKEIHTFLLQDQTFLVINKDKYKYFKDFFESVKAVMENYETTSELFFEMIDYFTTRTYDLLQTLQFKIEALQTQVFDFGQQSDFIADISILQRNVINFRGIISPLKITLDDLQYKSFFTQDKDSIVKLDDTQDKIKKIIHNLDNLNNLVSIIKETNEHIISRSTNETIKVLTAISLIYTPATVVTSFFGMNIYFGWEYSTHSPWPLVGILLGILSFTFGTYIYLHRKKLI